MKKLSTCVLSAGLAMLIGISGVNAATKISARAQEIFGKYIISFATDTKAISAGLAEVKKSVTNASSKLEKLSMNTKKFRSEYEVASPLVIAYNLDQGASVLEKISRVLSILNDGLVTMNKAKKKRDDDENNARDKIHLALKALQAAEGFLPSIKANIAVLGKFIDKKEKSIDNAEEVKETLQTIINNLLGKEQTDDSSEKKQKKFSFFSSTKKEERLIELMNEYQRNYQDISNNIIDNDIKGWFKNWENYITGVNNTLKLFKELLQVVVAYLNNQEEKDKIVNLAYKCEKELRPENKKLIMQKVRNSFREEEDENNAPLKKRSKIIGKKNNKKRKLNKSKSFSFGNQNSLKDNDEE